MPWTDECIGEVTAKVQARPEPVRSEAWVEAGKHEALVRAWLDRDRVGCLQPHGGLERP